MFKTNMVVNGLSISVTKKAKLRNLYVRILPPEGEVTVTGPSDVSDETIRLFIIKRFSEISKVRDGMRSQLRQSRREYVSGESHYLWGKPYILQVIEEGTRYKIQKTPAKIILYVPPGAKTEGKERAFTEWYRKELKRALETVVPRCEEKTGLHADEVKIKNMKTRWGTCNTDKKRICINLQLAKKPPECLEYIVVHELTHLKEKNHTNLFHELLEKYCPSWEETRKTLSALPLDYMEKDDGNPDMRQGL